MPKSQRKPVDLDQHRRQTDTRLVFGGFTVVITVGGLVMWLLYGLIPALIGEAVIFGGMLVFVLLWLLLRALETWAKSE